MQEPLHLTLTIMSHARRRNQFVWYSNRHQSDGHRQPPSTWGLIRSFFDSRAQGLATSSEERRPNRLMYGQCPACGFGAGNPHGRLLSYEERVRYDKIQASKPRQRRHVVSNPYFQYGPNLAFEYGEASGYGYQHPNHPWG